MNRSGSVTNQLLAALPKTERERILRSVDIVPLRLKSFLQSPGEPVRHVYFPGGGFISVVTVLEDGRMVEVATIGREGAAGVAAGVDVPALPTASLVQGAHDVCYRMTTAVFRREIVKRGDFQTLMTRYSNALVGFIMQSTACNAVHLVEQRLARWLLMANDRMAANEFPLTQEFVAMMLGTSRPTVSVVAGTLQNAGLISYRRGRVTIVDRRRLEAASCECYHTTTNLLNSVTIERPRASRAR